MRWWLEPDGRGTGAIDERRCLVLSAEAPTADPLEEQIHASPMPSRAQHLFSLPRSTVVELVWPFFFLRSFKRKGARNLQTVCPLGASCFSQGDAQEKGFALARDGVRHEPGYGRGWGGHAGGPPGALRGCSSYLSIFVKAAAC